MSWMYLSKCSRNVFSCWFYYTQMCNNERSRRYLSNSAEIFSCLPTSHVPQAVASWKTSWKKVIQKRWITFSSQLSRQKFLNTDIFKTRLEHNTLLNCQYLYSCSIFDISSEFSSLVATLFNETLLPSSNSSYTFL